MYTFTPVGKHSVVVLALDPHPFSASVLRSCSKRYVNRDKDWKFLFNSMDKATKAIVDAQSKCGGCGNQMSAEDADKCTCKDY